MSQEGGLYDACLCKCAACCLFCLIVQFRALYIFLAEGNGCVYKVILLRRNVLRSFFFPPRVDLISLAALCIFTV